MSARPAMALEKWRWVREHLGAALLVNEGLPRSAGAMKRHEFE